MKFLKKAMKKATQPFEKAFKPIGKNIERNFADVAQNFSLIASGKWDKGFSSMLHTGLATATGGLINPDDLKSLTGETGIDRVRREAQESLQAQNEADVAAQAAETFRANSLAVNALVESRKRSPGRALTLLNGKDSVKTNTLLSLIK